MGAYKVNLGYELLRGRKNYSYWPTKLCLGRWIFPKAGAFLWIALHGHILIGERLKSISFARPNWCILCKADVESVDHLLLWCPFAKECWDWLLSKLQ